MKNFTLTTTITNRSSIHFTCRISSQPIESTISIIQMSGSRTSISIMSIIVQHLCTLHNHSYYLCCFVIYTKLKSWTNKQTNNKVEHNCKLKRICTCQYIQIEI
jgi:hypothetical protein